MNKIKQINCRSLPVTVPVDFNGDIKTWLEQQANAHNLRWLLAHADDGAL